MCFAILNLSTIRYTPLCFFYKNIFMHKLFQAVFILGTYVLFSYSCFAQTISGYIKDKETMQPLAGANVYWQGNNYGTQSNGSGQYILPKTNSNILIISYVGYKTKQIIISEYLPREPILLEKTIFQADEVVVHATRANQQTGMAYTNIGGPSIQKQNSGQDLPYLLGQSTSLITTSDAGSGIGYTGMRIRGTDATRINVTINGIPLNEAESQGVYWVNTPDLASSVSSIQIQRGVGTSANGAGAFGASVNIQSNEYQPVAYLESNNSIGSFGTLKNTLKMGTGLIANKFTIDGRLSNISSDGYIDRAFSKLKSYYASVGFFGKKSFIRLVNFGGKEKTYQAWNGIAAATLDTNRRYNSFSYANQTDNYYQNHSQFLSTHYINSHWTLNANLHYTRGKGYYEEEKLDEKLNKYNIEIENLSKANLVRQKWLDNHFYGITYSLDFKPNSKLTASLGGAANQYLGDHFGDVINIYEKPSFNKHRWYFSKTTKNDINIYQKTTAYLSDKTNIYTDLQYRKISVDMKGTASKMQAIGQNHSYEFFNPKIGLNHNLNAQASLYASYAVAQKEPNRTDFIDNNAQNLPKAEQLADLELGLRYFKKRSSLIINSYYMAYKNQLALTGAINDTGEPIRTNIPESYRLGLEIEFATKIYQKWAWEANTTISSNKVSSFTEQIPDYEGNNMLIVHQNTNLAFSPGIVGASTLHYKPNSNWDFSLQNKYVGRQYLDNTSNKSRSLKAYHTADIRLQYQIPYKKLKNLQLGLFIYNIYNHQYQNNGYTYSYLYENEVYTENFYYPQAGRNFILTINLKL
jgi:iron complex outermembrane recepter protein